MVGYKKKKIRTDKKRSSVERALAPRDTLHVIHHRFIFLPAGPEAAGFLTHSILLLQVHPVFNFHFLFFSSFCIFACCCFYNG